MNAIQYGELGVALEEIALNLRDSIVFQMSAENERIGGSEMRTLHAIFTLLLQKSKLREALERIRFNGGNVAIAQPSTKHMAMGTAIAGARDCN